MPELDSAQVNRLLLYSKSAQPATHSASSLLDPLRDIGLIANACTERAGDYLPGEAFVNLVSFLGCSPDIALTPDDGEHYCFIRLHDSTLSPHLYQGINTRAPRCSHCQQAMADWLECEKQDYCDRCSLADRISGWQWRRQGALSCWVIELMNIYPHEAVPSSQLLTFLETASGVEWGYAYLQADN
jgi:hypothetical protein